MNVVYKTFKDSVVAKKRILDLFYKDHKSVLIVPSKAIKDEVVVEDMSLVKAASGVSKSLKDGIAIAPVNTKMVYLFNPTPKDMVAIVEYCVHNKLGLTIFDVNP